MRSILDSDETQILSTFGGSTSFVEFWQAVSEGSLQEAQKEWEEISEEDQQLIIENVGYANFVDINLNASKVDLIQWMMSQGFPMQWETGVIVYLEGNDRHLAETIMSQHYTDSEKITNNQQDLFNWLNEISRTISSEQAKFLIRHWPEGLFSRFVVIQLIHAAGPEPWMIYQFNLYQLQDMYRESYGMDDADDVREAIITGLYQMSFTEVFHNVCPEEISEQNRRIFDFVQKEFEDTNQ